MPSDRSDRRSADEPGSLAFRLPTVPLFLYLAASGILALAYGSSFLLADTLQQSGFSAPQAGSVISVGIVATLASSLFAGRFAQRTGLVPAMAIASTIMAVAMLCFAFIGNGGMAAAYSGGLLFGTGWAIFYMLAPIQLIHMLAASARVEALTLLSGAQMVGIGFSAPLGRFLARHLGDPTAAYLVYAGLCLAGAAAMLSAWRSFRRLPQLPMHTVALSFAQVREVLGARTVIPVAMIGLAACTFAGLSTFQSVYGQSRGLSPDIYFLTFTTATVALRFSLARFLGRLPLPRLMCLLFILIFIGLAMFIVNTGSFWLYLVATLVYATGYGLTYASLNAMAVNLAGECGVSIPGSSQVFTLGYFTGLFGFPYIAGILIAHSGIDTVLKVMMGIIALNLAAALLIAAGFRLPARRPQE